LLCYICLGTFASVHLPRYICLGTFALVHLPRYICLGTFIPLFLPFCFFTLLFHLSVSL
jgi:hypothetical protein